MQARSDVIDVFVDNCELLRRALGQQVVADAWAAPAVLAGMTVGALACHLAEASIDITLDNLAREQPDPGVQLITAAEYYVRASDTFSSVDHERFRDRSSSTALDGHHALTERLAAEVPRLTSALRALTDERIVPVFGGAAMSLDQYIVTRLVEQVVHLDDLARSLNVALESDPRADDLVVRCGGEIGQLRFGPRAMIRALYRGQADPFPVI